MRGIKELVTQTGKSFEMYEYATGRDVRLASMFSEKKEEALDEMIKNIVVSFDGKKENILENILDGDARDYIFIVEKVTEIFQGVNSEKKTE